VQRPRLPGDERSHAVGVDPRLLWVVALALPTLTVALLVGTAVRRQATPELVALFLVMLGIWLWLGLGLMTRPVDVITSPRGVATIDALSRRREIAWNDLVEIRARPSRGRTEVIELHGRDPVRMLLRRALVGRSLRTIPDSDALVNTIRTMAPNARFARENY
jgi:hypothetical protein